MKPNRFTATLAVPRLPVPRRAALLAQSSDIFGPNPTRRQLHVAGSFVGDTMFKQPIIRRQRDRSASRSRS